MVRRLDSDTMASDLTLPPVTAAAPLESPRASAERGFTAEPSATEAAAAEPAKLVPNPRLRIDGALGLVVIEFRDRIGQGDYSIPSPRQLAAYQFSARTGGEITPAHFQGMNAHTPPASVAGAVRADTTATATTTATTAPTTGSAAAAATSQALPAAADGAA
jgi:hypothetical protein